MLHKTKKEKKNQKPKPNHISSLRACSLQILECSLQTHHVLERLKEVIAGVCQPLDKGAHRDSQHCAILSALKRNQEKGPEIL